MEGRLKVVFVAMQHEFARARKVRDADGGALLGGLSVVDKDKEASVTVNNDPDCHGGRGAAACMQMQN
jgi:hypothetical protein